MVGQCIVDRLASGEFGDSVEAIVTAEGQFALSDEASPETLEVARAIAGGERFAPDYEILFFRATDSREDWFAPRLGAVGGHTYYGHERREGQP